MRKKKYLSPLCLALFFMILAGCFSLFSRRVADPHVKQSASGAWRGDNEARYAQISCFTSKEGGLTDEDLRVFERTVDEKLRESALAPAPEHPSAKLWVDAYSAAGRISVVKGKKEVEAEALGVGGDFFLFHPAELLSGYYFSGDALMRDAVVLDSALAWRLFGAYDVGGLEVEINGRTHLVAGVVKPDEGKYAELTYGDAPRIWISFDLLAALDKTARVTCYEAVLPDPITGFAKAMIADHIGIPESEREIKEVSGRFSAKRLFPEIFTFPARSVVSKPVVYPYWENKARIAEDSATILLALTLLSLCGAFACAFTICVLLWRGRKWRIKDLRNLFERLREKHWEKQRKRQEERDENLTAASKKDLLKLIKRIIMKP